MSWRVRRLSMCAGAALIDAAAVGYLFWIGGVSYTERHPMTAIAVAAGMLAGLFAWRAAARATDEWAAERAEQDAKISARASVLRRDVVDALQMASEELEVCQQAFVVAIHASTDAQARDRLERIMYRAERAKEKCNQVIQEEMQK